MMDFNFFRCLFQSNTFLFKLFWFIKLCLTDAVSNQIIVLNRIALKNIYLPFAFFTANFILCFTLLRNSYLLIKKIKEKLAYIYLSSQIFNTTRQQSHIEAAPACL